jgi:hypothetical protein
MAQKQGSTDLGVLQREVENAAKVLKAAKRAAETAKAAHERAEDAYSVSQKALTAGVEQIKVATKV